MPRRVYLLDELVANQIAAGEVIERPASVLKELVENSIDSGAKRIEIEIEGAGSKLIRVVDDGCGMNRDDALLCLERHATSKIKTPGDIASIRSMGFRGEAIPSIASIAKVRVRTAEPGALSGTEVAISGGRIESVRESGMPPGTQFEVRQLFFNTPGRRKFLRSPETELGHLEQCCRLFALAHSDIAWRYTVDGRPVYQLPAAAPLRRIEDLFGREFVSNLVAISAKRAPFELHGWVGRAGVSRSARTDELWFVNRRPVDNRTLYYALREGYQNALMKGRHPIAILHLALPHDRVDVNVHPAKREVRFRDDFELRHFIVESVRDALTVRHVEPVRPRESVPRPEPPPAGPPPESAIPAPANGSAQAAPAPPAPLLPPERIERPLHLPLEMSAIQPAAAPTPTKSFGPMQLRVLGIFRKLYIAAESPAGLVLIDQHAAHERVLFERVLKQRMAGGAPSQGLLVPISIEFSPREAAFLNGQLAGLAEAGLVLHEFGRNTFLVDSIPPFFPPEKVKSLVLDIVADLQAAGGETKTSRHLSEEIVTRTVCRMAIKANDTIRDREIDALLRDLLACDLPYTCPHGRPTMILLSDADLERKFGRAV